VVVLLNLTLFWWFRDQPPFPRSSIIARRMGVSARTVQRVFKKLERLGYIRRGQTESLLLDKQHVGDRLKTLA
jgi:Mn-dependent DtxR family transcriptional regulator